MQTIFGPVFQTAYVVEDLDAALRHWTRTMGVGPFWVFDHVQFSELHYRGEPTNADTTAAMGYWGDLQIELVVQHNQAPSIYKEFLDRGYRGMQHLAVMTDDVDAHLQRLEPLGIMPTQHGKVKDGIHFAYVGTDFHPGGMIELVEATDAIVGVFDYMRQSARDWDGKDPVRRF